MASPDHGQDESSAHVDAALKQHPKEVKDVGLQMQNNSSSGPVPVVPVQDDVMQQAETTVGDGTSVGDVTAFAAEKKMTTEEEEDIGLVGNAPVPIPIGGVTVIDPGAIAPEGGGAAANVPGGGEELTVVFVLDSAYEETGPRATFVDHLKVLIQKCQSQNLPHAKMAEFAQLHILELIDEVTKAGAKCVDPQPHTKTAFTFSTCSVQEFKDKLPQANVLVFCGHMGPYTVFGEDHNDLWDCVLLSKAQIVGFFGCQVGTARFGLLRLLSSQSNATAPIVLVADRKMSYADLCKSAIVKLLVFLDDVYKGTVELADVKGRVRCAMALSSCDCTEGDASLMMCDRRQGEFIVDQVMQLDNCFKETLLEFVSFFAVDRNPDWVIVGPAIQQHVVHFKLEAAMQELQCIPEGLIQRARGNLSSLSGIELAQLFIGGYQGNLSNSYAAFLLAEKVNSSIMNCSDDLYKLKVALVIICDIFKLVIESGDIVCLKDSSKTGSLSEQIDWTCAFRHVQKDWSSSDDYQLSDELLPDYKVKDYIESFDHQLDGKVCKVKLTCRASEIHLNSDRGVQVSVYVLVGKPGSKTVTRNNNARRVTINKTYQIHPDPHEILSGYPAKQKVVAAFYCALATGVWAKLVSLIRTDPMNDPLFPGTLKVKHANLDWDLALIM
jgi:hypothetical protein